MSEARGSGRVIGFDFGLSSIGLAVGNLRTQTVTPLGANRARDGKPDWDQMDATMREWEPEIIVVGIPLNMDGTESEMSSRAQKFLRRLQARYHLPCHSLDERLTTREAREELGQGRTFNKAALDAQAASIILRNWLEQHSFSEQAPHRT